MSSGARRDQRASGRAVGTPELAVGGRVGGTPELAAGPQSQQQDPRVSNKSVVPDGRIHSL